MSYNRSLSIITENDTHIAILLLLYIISVTNSFDYETLTIAGYMFITVIIFMSYAFYINDFFDMPYDILAGKKRFVQDIPEEYSIILMALMTVTAYLIIIFLIKNPLYLVIYTISYILGTFYSAPPFRFKERGLYGLIGDMLIEKTCPLLLVAGAFYYFGWDAVLIIAAFSIMQIYLILRHQYTDFEADKSSNVVTFVTEIGKSGAEKIIRFLQPLILLTLLGIYLLAAYNIEALRIPFIILTAICVIIYLIYRNENQVESTYLNTILLITETVFPFILGVYISFIYYPYIIFVILVVVSNYPYIMKGLKRIQELY